ncbi:hypothetical protein I6J42_05590 [Streptomyces californicus]|uniref:Uncharacterized protein n=1 Tax=Streptomyces californicus TaxID=67351 RepID=A0ABD7CSL8_9ACTN|nr:MULTISPECIES: hypothetical protein [Streptomyces]QRV30810.1 hypothetical protein I6J39_28495 [Streptomyces californicus]QRV33581.1 hypothetical protein I6J42_05590 [Streptomyces californicus]QRV44225.1 hypothetical protein I6J41_28425 [Streptomyces californicus]QRV50914.1 hypothetical protein I6J43_28055 [Streptomyces californicus]
MSTGTSTGGGADDDGTYCVPAGPGAPAAPPGPGGAAGGPPYAECVLCREPTEYPESTPGATLCPVCAWQEAGRSACSG